MKRRGGTIVSTLFSVIKFISINVIQFVFFYPAKEEELVKAILVGK
jgi:hypothetical protein